MALGTECIHTMQALCMQGQQRAQSTQLSGMLILCMAVIPSQQPGPPASQSSPVRMDMSWREFSEPWHLAQSAYCAYILCQHC
jgi:hypothetical protein